MKTLRLVLLSLSLSLSLLLGADAPTARILSTAGAPHPKIQVLSVDRANGVLMFRWLDASGKPVDSGNSIAKFTPATPLKKGKPDDPEKYPVIADAALAAAIVATTQ